MNVGIITHNYPLYQGQSKDAGKFIYNFAQTLSFKVGKVFVLCPNFKGKKEKYKNVPVTWFKWRGGGSKLGSLTWWSPTGWWMILDLLINGQRATADFVKQNSIDYLIVFWNFPGGVFAWYANRKLGIPYLTWALGSDIFVYGKLPIIKQLINLVLTRATYSFGNSFNICRTIVKEFGKKSLFLPTANSLALKENLIPKLNKLKFNFLYVGRMESVKGPDILIDAVTILNQKRNDFHIFMIGEGSMESLLKDEVSKRNLSELISILGYIEDQKVVNGYFLNTDCLVIPSRSESFPLVITEALQAGLPMIGSSVGDMPFFIPKHGLGFVFKKEDPKGLAKIMDKTIERGKDIRKNKKTYMKKLAGAFNINNIADSLISYINRPR